MRRPCLLGFHTRKSRYPFYRRLQNSLVDLAPNILFDIKSMALFSQNYRLNGSALGNESGVESLRVRDLEDIIFCAEELVHWGIRVLFE